MKKVEAWRCGKCNELSETEKDIRDHELICFDKFDETYSPVCPYCEHSHDEEVNGCEFQDAGGDSYKCRNCGRFFEVYENEVQEYETYTTKKTRCEGAHRYIHLGDVDYMAYFECSKCYRRSVIETTGMHCVDVEED